MLIAALQFVAVFAPCVAIAETPQQNALARTLFEEGVALADRGDWVGAADRFGRAYSLKPTSGVAFNLASALSETGELLRAQELLHAVLRDESADSQIKTSADTLLSSLTPRIARLQVHVANLDKEACSVEVDGHDWPRAAWDVASPVDPGAHGVVLKQSGVEQARAEVQLQEGETRTLNLEVVPEVATPLPAPAPLSIPTREEHKPLYKNWMVWTGVAAVVVAGTVTAAVLATRSDHKQASPVMGNASPGVIRW